MVLAVDIGNSNICIGGLSGAGHRDILFTVRMVTRPRCTPDEYAAELRFLLARLQVDPRGCEGVIVCSVVPGLTGVLAAACERLTGCPAMIVSCELDCGMTFKVDEPARVGRDRIADAAAAAAYYPLPCMTVDLGTATTYNVISENAEFLGGFIVPGVQTSLRAISKGTAQLPPIAPEPPEVLIGRCPARRMVVCTACRTSSASIPVNGSSISSVSASRHSSARSSATRRFCPPESLAAGSLSSAGAKPSASSSFSAVSAQSPCPVRTRLSTAFSCGQSRSS